MEGQRASTIEEPGSSDLPGVSEPTLSRWRNSGEGLPFLTVSKGIFRYHPESVQQWVKENER